MIYGASIQSNESRQQQHNGGIDNNKKKIIIIIVLGCLTGGRPALARKIIIARKPIIYNKISFDGLGSPQGTHICTASEHALYTEYLEERRVNQQTRIGSILVY